MFGPTVAAAREPAPNDNADDRRCDRIDRISPAECKRPKIWGELQPYDQVWRAGAIENTTFEVTRDVTIDGKPLPPENMVSM